MSKKSLIITITSLLLVVAIVSAVVVVYFKTDKFDYLRTDYKKKYTQELDKNKVLASEQDLLEAENSALRTSVTNLNSENQVLIGNIEDLEERLSAFEGLYLQSKERTLNQQVFIIVGDYYYYMENGKNIRIYTNAELDNLKSFSDDRDNKLAKVFKGYCDVYTFTDGITSSQLVFYNYEKSHYKEVFLGLSGTTTVPLVIENSPNSYFTLKLELKGYDSVNKSIESVWGIDLNVGVLNE